MSEQAIKGIHNACRYVDYPVTDILQMIGHANRPLIDDDGKLMIGKACCSDVLIVTQVWPY